MYYYFLLFKKIYIFCEFYLWCVTSWPLPVITGKCSNARETPLIRPKSLAQLQPTALAAYFRLTELLQPIKSQPSQPSWLMKEKKKRLQWKSTSQSITTAFEVQEGVLGCLFEKWRHFCWATFCSFLHQWGVAGYEAEIDFIDVPWGSVWSKFESNCRVISILF